MPAAQILVVDDEPDIRDLLADILADEGYAVGAAENAAAARRLITTQRWDAVLLDIWMPDTDGITLLREWSEAGTLDAPVIMMSGHGTIETAVEATRLGAYDFIEKPIALAKLLITLERALENRRLRQANDALRRAVTPIGVMVGSSRATDLLRNRLAPLAAHSAPVLLRGEAGTGKETLARWLHEQGPRVQAPFITVAAGAVADERAAATLFGEENETGIATGLVEQAQGGTLFLDEVADLGAELQLRLSSIIERREMLRVGGRKPLPLDVRIIAASARDLEAERSSGRLREELYFQLNVLPVAVPPLRDRREDIPDLLAQMVSHFAARDGLSERSFAAAALERLQHHTWPGNLRELRNLAQRLLLLGRGEVTLAEIDTALGSDSGETPTDSTSTNGFAIDFNLPLREARDAFERAYLLHQLAESGGSVGKLSKMSGMERTHLYRKLRDLGIDLRGGKEG